MNFKQLVSLLSDHKDKGVRFAFSDKSYIPNHFHITEVGRVQKDFVDCGGTIHKSSSCVLQTWVADDVEHRLKANKFLEILKKANSLFHLIKKHTACLAPDKCLPEKGCCGSDKKGCC